ncbi:MAG: hypothetical protein HYS05_12495 [Acidobacteria bacterium]|nr:hypothetical protein [Acidobacteriota bacterium]
MPPGHAKLRYREDNVTEPSRVLLAAVVGAVVGAAVGWIYTTASGQRFREEAEPRLDHLRTELTRLRRTVRKASAVASESWDSINELVGDKPRPAWGGTLPQH